MTKEPLRIAFAREGDDVLTVTLDGERYRLARQREREVVREPVVRSGAGEILFVKYEVSSMEVGGRKIEIPRPKLWVMFPDGSKARKIWDVKEDESVQEPWCAPDGNSYLAASDIHRWQSALAMDVWFAPRGEGGLRRVTGNSEPPPKTGRTGALAITLTDDTGGLEGRLINYSWQGNDGKVEKGEAKGKLEAIGVPAGRIWVRCWFDRHRGDLQVVDVPAGGVATVELKLSPGNRYATYPSATPDGRRIVCLSQHAYWDPAKPSQPEQGFDTMAVVDGQSGQLLALWDPTKNGGAFAKDPRVSPDGKWIAFAMGMPGMEALAVCSLEGFLAGKPEPRTLVPGDRLLGQGTFGNVSPAWSPDGTAIAFTRYFMSTSIRGNLMVVPAAGGTPRAITNLAGNQCPTYPTWSPDGRRIAFQLVTSRGPVLDILDLIRVNVVSDVCVVGADGSGLTNVTNDGRSAQPAWAR